jgi:hypothetical protein
MPVDGAADAAAALCGIPRAGPGFVLLPAGPQERLFVTVSRE